MSASGGVGRVRRNTAIAAAYSGNDYGYVFGKLSTTTPYQVNFWSQGYCEDEEHPLWVRGLTKVNALELDVGGPFLSYQVRNNFPIVSMAVASGKPPGNGIVRSYVGPICAWPQYAVTNQISDSTWFQNTVLDSVATRWGMGATAISRCKPGSPEASFGVFLAETFREGIPSLLSNFQVRGQVSHFRSLGSNYLNVEFGWKPFVSDLRKTARSLWNQAEILEDLQRNSGRAMRRQYKFPDLDPAVIVLSTNNVLPWPVLTATHWNQGSRTVTQTTTKKSWFSGEFVYRYPPIDAKLPIRMKAWARQILGLDLTPETLWNITPWTWLADWFANTGDVLANVSAISADDLVMRYGYLMQEVKREIRHVHEGVVPQYGSVPRTFSGTTTYSVKSRIGASPYGFGMTWNDLSPRQFAILAAIGITRRGNS